MRPRYLVAALRHHVVDVVPGKPDIAEQVVVELEQVRVDLAPARAAEQRREHVRHFGRPSIDFAARAAEGRRYALATMNAG